MIPLNEYLGVQDGKVFGAQDRYGVEKKLSKPQGKELELITINKPGSYIAECQPMTFIYENNFLTRAYSKPHKTEHQQNSKEAKSSVYK